MNYDKIIRDLAVTQHSALSRQQLNDAGVNYRAINRRVQAGTLEWVTDRVLRVTSAPPSEEQRLMIPLLHVGPETYISHTTAAAWWGIAGFRLEPIHVALERYHRRTREIKPVVVHHSTVIPQWCRKIHRGVPVVSPALAIYQLAGTVSRERAARALDSGWSLRLFDGRVIDRLLLELGRSGRNGTANMRELRQERSGDWIPPASNLESRVDRLLAENGLRFRRQVDIGDEVWTGRVDFLSEDCPLIVEVLSERFHTSLSDRQADEVRRARHTAIGFVVVEVWDYEIFFTPWVVIARIRRAREEVLRSLGRNRP